MYKIWICRVRLRLIGLYKYYFFKEHIHEICEQQWRYESLFQFFFRFSESLNFRSNLPNFICRFGLVIGLHAQFQVYVIQND